MRSHASRLCWRQSTNVEIKCPICWAENSELSMLSSSLKAGAFFFFFLNLVLINRRNGSRYQNVLALCVFSLTGMTPKGLILRKFCVWCLCTFFKKKFMQICVRTNFVVSGWFVVWWLACRVNSRQIEHSFKPWCNPLWLTRLKIPTNWLEYNFACSDHCQGFCLI